MALPAMVPSGKRDKKVRIEQLTAPDAAGTAGEPVEAWTRLTDVFMEKVDTTGEEAFRADQLSARYDTRWVMPYLMSMDPDTVDVPKTRRLLFKGRYYDITNAALIGSNAGIEIMTLTGTRVAA